MHAGYRRASYNCSTANFTISTHCIDNILRARSLPNEPYPQLRHDIKMAALWGDNVQSAVQRAYGEVSVSLCSPCTMQEKTLVRHVNYLPM